MATQTHPPASPDRITPARARSAAALLVLVVIAALNLRPTITTLGPLLPDVRDGLHMNGVMAGLLTSLPSACFALFGPLAPALARRFGLLGVLGGGLAAITVGLLARAAAPTDAVFLLFTALALAGIAVSNVLMPAIISRNFPDRIGTMTGLYAGIMAGGSAITAAVAVPVTGLLGGSWREGLGVWALLSVGGAALALVLRDGRPAASARPAGASLRSSRTARAMALFFGMCATAAYSLMGWMPQIYRDAGLSPTYAGLLLALTMILGVPLSFLIPALAAHRDDQRPLVAVLMGCGVIAYAGLAFAPATLPWLWATLSGIALSAFSLALTMLGLRSRTHEGVARLSSFAQSTGYLISIPGPLLIGVLYQHTGSWKPPIALLTALLVPQLLAGLRAARPGKIEDELTA
ncbi:MFS transporter [Actinocorallia longicatena]|uniref:MFS transporter n=1 Tax=Actinocorallia longicatena TaxID=111803 RepID=A0ABP6QFF8_9ACTN